MLLPSKKNRFSKMNISDCVKEKEEEVLGVFGSDLDGRFKTARTSESNLGSFLAEVMTAALQVSSGKYFFRKYFTNEPRLTVLSSTLELSEATPSKPRVI